MLALMPAPPGAKPEIAEGVIGTVEGYASVGNLAFVVLGNTVEYDADLVVSSEMERVIAELPEEVDAFLSAYSRARGYAVAAHFFGMHSWN